MTYPTKIATAATRMTDGMFWQRFAAAKGITIHDKSVFNATFKALADPDNMEFLDLLEEMPDGTDILANTIGDEDARKIVFAYAAGVFALAATTTAKEAVECVGRVDEEGLPHLCGILGQRLEVEYPEQLYISEIYGADYSLLGAFTIEFAKFGEKQGHKVPQGRPGWKTPINFRPAAVPV